MMLEYLLHLNLFPFYAGGIAISLWLSRPDAHAADLSASVLLTYAAVKIIAILSLHELGAFWYIVCGLAQFWIMMQAEGNLLEYRVIRGLCVAGMCLNAWAYLTYHHHDHITYWLLANSIQTLQVLVLVFLSPVAMLAIGRWLLRHRIRRPLWFIRLASERIRYSG